MPDPVFKAMEDYLHQERTIGGYETAAENESSLEGFYTSFAKLLNAQPEEIAFIENATRAWDMAFYALPLKSGDRIITHTAEYSSNYLAFLQLAKRIGVEIDIAPSDASGQIDVDALPALVTAKTKVINLVHVPTQGGLVNPAESVGKFAHDHGLIYVLDACQSVGQMEVDVSKIGCHILSGTGRKFLRGPRGTGFLYVSNNIVADLEPPFIDMRAATWTAENNFEYAPGARRFENWESFFAGRLGLATAVDYALAVGMPQIEDRVTTLARYLRDSLNDIDGIEVADLGERQCGIVTFAANFEKPSDMAVRLRTNKVNTSVSEKTSAQLDLGRRDIEELLRASVHYFNTESEIDRFCELVTTK